MLHTLHGKLSAVLLVLLILLGLVFVPLTVFTTRNYIAEVNQKLNRELAADLARHLNAQNLLSADLETNPTRQKAAKAIFSRSMLLNPDIEIYVLDETGRVIFCSAPPESLKRQKVSLAPIQQLLRSAKPLPIMGDDPRDRARSKVFSAAKLPLSTGQKSELRGFVYIILNGEKYEAIAGSTSQSFILRLSAWATFGALAATFLTAALLFAVLTRRLRRLNHGVAAFQNGDFAALQDAPQNPHRRDEIAHLETAFSQMAAQIGAQVKSLEVADTNRREAVSNVSHDLRTPLAALQGYLETLSMKAGALSPEQEREYLAIAIKHAERLGKLISALFELVKLDSLEMEPNWEPFSLPELVQDVAQQFQLAAEKKGVQLQTELPQLPMAVADIGLVERALENLLENALRHTPEGGIVTVALHRKGGRVQIVVADNGEGIAPDDLPRIFQRSFRAARHKGEFAQTQNDEGAGLGLAITKRIAELHESEIDVQSTLGQGATFSFSLPLQI